MTDSSKLNLVENLTLDPVSRTITLKSNANVYEGSNFGIKKIDLLSGTFRMTGKWDLRNTIIEASTTGSNILMSGSFWLSESTFVSNIKTISCYGETTLKFSNSSFVPSLIFQSTSQLTFDPESSVETFEFSTSDSSIFYNLTGKFVLPKNIILSTLQKNLSFTATGNGTIKILNEENFFDINSLIHVDVILVPRNSNFIVSVNYLSNTMRIFVTENLIIDSFSSNSFLFKFHSLILTNLNSFVHFKPNINSFINTIDATNSTLIFDGQITVNNANSDQYFYCKYNRNNPFFFLKYNINIQIYKNHQ